jgi:stage III sporulation protein AD
MTFFVKALGIGLITVASSLLIKQSRPEFSFFISLSGTFIVFFICVKEVESYLSSFLGILSDVGFSAGYFSVALKAVGIGYITEFAADTAGDSGHSALASKITLAGRTLLFIIALPVIKDLLSLAVRLVD